MQISTKTASDLLHLAKSKLHTGLKALTIAALAGALLAVPGITQAVSLIELGNLGTSHTFAYAVSNDGTSVVGYSRNDDNGKNEAFVWTSYSGMTGLDTLGHSISSTAKAISTDGTIVVGTTVVGEYTNAEAFIWNKEDGMTGLGTLGGSKSYARDVSADGTFVVGYSKNTSNDDEAFIWTESSGMTGLGDLGGDHSTANAISADGTTVVGSSKNEDNNAEAFIWTEEDGMTGLGVLSTEAKYVYSYASDISADSSTVVGYSYNENSKLEAFIWTEEDGIQGLGTLSDDGMSMAQAVSGDGSIVAGYYSDEDNTLAMLWTEETGMLSLWDLLTEEGVDLSGWTALLYAYDISDDGNIIVGTGCNSDGDYAGWIIDLEGLSICPSVPVPGAVWLLGSGLLGLTGLRRRNRGLVNSDR